MYAWLSDALRESSQVVTASRRLARVLAAHFAEQQLSEGRSAWRSPPIVSWQEWLTGILLSAELSRSLPTRINANQSRVLWERCLRREVPDPLLNLATLAREARESWARLHDFDVPLDECEAAARGKDQLTFIRAARGYQSILEREHWIDEAQLAGLATELVNADCTTLAGRVTVAGFDRLTPAVTALLEAVENSGVTVEKAPGPQCRVPAVIHSYENSDAEMRAAGAWAREVLTESPQQRVAIVSAQLDQNAIRWTRLIREGLAPGWQTAGADHRAAVNVSYGRKLASYPVCAVALLALRWLLDDLPGRDVSTLLRSGVIGKGHRGGRSRLELALRQLPDRNWSPAMLTGALRGRDDSADAQDLLARIAVLSSRRDKLPRRAAPAEWAVLIDQILGELNWPGDDALDSAEFQLINRWRELLNDLARLALVSPTMTLSEVLARLTTMAAETVFQPESEGSLVQLLGPLEAAGVEFDQLWITGLSAANWPPRGGPLTLVSRQLQRRYGMPDADPCDTLDYARRVLGRLLASAANVRGSFPLTDGDAEQTETGLLLDMETRNEEGGADPGWHATRLLDCAHTDRIAEDRVPAVTGDESVSGGAATITRQFVEPFSAFAFGRLGIRWLPGISSGLAANLRGSLMHDALHALYRGLPAQEELAGWEAAERHRRVASAAGQAFVRHERFADPTLGALLQLERARVANLLQRIISLDLLRAPFEIREVEVAVQTDISGLPLKLRIDRIDRLPDGEVVILDYKTGARKRFLNNQGEPADMQLVVYAAAIDDAVAGLALVNIDTRSVAIDGAGRDFTPDLDWHALLPRWQDEVAAAADDIRHGDVRINTLQNRQAARPLSLLTRIAELRHDV